MKVTGTALELVIDLVCWRQRITHPPPDGAGGSVPVATNRSDWGGTGCRVALRSGGFVFSFSFLGRQHLFRAGDSADDMSAANIVARRFCAELCLSKPVRTVFVGRLLTVIAGRARLGEMRLLNILFDCAAVLCDTPAWRAIGAMETEAALVIVS